METRNLMLTLMASNLGEYSHPQVALLRWWALTFFFGVQCGGGFLSSEHAKLTAASPFQNFLHCSGEDPVGMKG
jgi:hypothetical protein